MASLSPRGRDLLSRRNVLRAAGAIVPLGLAAPHVFASSRPALSLDPVAAPPICHASVAVPLTVVDGPRRNLRLTWNASAICTVGVPVAQTKGYFEKRNLAVELINFGGSTDQLLEAIASGKADAGVGMALRWLRRAHHHRNPWRLHAAAGRQGQRHHPARGPEGEGDRCQRHGGTGQELLLDPPGQAWHRSAQ
jgi:NMT1/THI5 like